MPHASVLIVVPARLSSSRLPRKMLLAETGRPLVEHTWLAARRSRTAGHVVVATDSAEIAAAVRGFGGEAVMTSPECTSGTARIVEALDRLPDAEIIVNVQGDEPELAGAAIDTAVDLLGRCPEAGVATLVTPLRREDDLHDPAAVKAVLTPWRDATGAFVAEAWRAIVFSRAPRSGQVGPVVPVQPAFIVRLALAHQVKLSPSGSDSGANGTSRLSSAATFGGSAGSMPSTFVGV